MSLLYHRDLGGGLVDKYAAVAARLKPGCRVLDMGCHTGYFVAALAKLGFDAVGIDGDPEAVAVAQQAGVTVTHADLEANDFHAKIQTQRGFDRPFDAICMMDVLEHLRDPTALLGKAKALLAPGGRLLVTGPNVAYWAVRKNLLLGRWNYTDGGILDRTHLWFFTAKTWRGLIENAGFRIVHFGPGEGMIPLEHLWRRIPVLGRGVDALKAGALKLMPNWFAIVFLIEACLQESPSS